MLTIRWKIVLTLVAIYVIFGLPVVLTQVSQDALNERHDYAIQRIENDIKAMQAINLEARLRVLEDSREESRQMLRVISAVLLGHIVTAIWQKRRTR